MAQQPIEIPVRLTGIAALKNDLKQIKSDVADNLSVLDQLNSKSDKYRESIAKGGSAAEMERLNKALAINEQRIANATKRNAELSAAAGQVKDRMTQINEQVQVFSSGSNFEQAANSLGLVGSQLANLDFEGAAESSLLLQKQISSITPEMVTKQMQGLQDTFTNLGKVAGSSLTGLVKNVGSISKAFLSFGKALLTNPIFLMAAAFIAIAGVIALLLDKLGLLKPILDAIGAVFGWIGDMIDAVVQGIKDFLDWIGLTDYAAEDSAKAHTKALEKKADAYEKSSKKVLFYLDEEIKLAQISGEDTYKLEIRKQKVIRETARVRLEALKAKYEENKLTNELDEEELKALHEKIDAQRELIRVANSETKIINAQKKADDKKDREEEKKAAEDQAKEQSARAKEAAEKRKRYAAERVQAERAMRDIELNSLADGYDKEVALNQEKYKRLIEDTRKNENLTAAEKKRFAELYLVEQQKELDAIKKQKEAAEKQQKTEEEERRAQDDAKALEIERRSANAREELRITLLKAGLEQELELLKFQKELELQDKELTEAEKALIEEKYRQQKEEKEEEYRQKKKEADKAAQEASFEIANVGLNAIAGLNDLAFELKKGKLKEGSAAEEAAAKRNFEINKKIQIAIATISGIQGVINALTAQSVIPEPFGTILKAANAVAVGVSTAVNIAKIKNTKYNSSGGSSGGGSGSAPTTSAAAATPSANLYGNANQFNSEGESKSKEAGGSGKEIVVKAVVAADEMTAEQMLQNNILNNSKL